MTTKRTKPRKVWHIVNTTVRNPNRIRQGLRALVVAGHEGRMQKDYEHQMAIALNEQGVIRLMPSTGDIRSISRKWRHAFVKLGLVWPDLSMLREIDSIHQNDIGEPFSLTPLGKALLQASGLRAEQEVFLRSLASLQLPSMLEPEYEAAPFSPLRHVIDILFTLENEGHQPSISSLEMASFVLVLSPEPDALETARLIADYRKRKEAEAHKRKYSKNELERRAKSVELRPTTLMDYQDVVIRYLKATGIFQSKGRGIALVPEHRALAKMLITDYTPELGNLEYLRKLCNGATLPTDSFEGAILALENLRTVASGYGIFVDESPYDKTDILELANLRHAYQDAIFLENESRFAQSQSSHIDEILCYMELLDKKLTTHKFKGGSLSIPREERPVYFEWILWRLLLAMNHLVTPPNRVRRFSVDQDFLPVHPAPGGGADVIAEYEDSVLVVEVTLTENSRQEAAEGEPVRRHVANVLENYQNSGKPVYGLFVARKIDTNTAHTFKIGIWYLKDDVEVALEIVPLTLKQLRTIIERGAGSKELHPKLLLDAIRECLSERRRAKNGPEWKRNIAKLIGV